MQMSWFHLKGVDLLQVWYTRLKGHCLEDGGSSPHGIPGQPDNKVDHGQFGNDGRRLVVDIGANFGYYSLYAAAHGCRCSHVDAFLFHGLQQGSP